MCQSTLTLPINMSENRWLSTATLISEFHFANIVGTCHSLLQCKLELLLHDLSQAAKYIFNHLKKARKLKHRLVLVLVFLQCKVSAPWRITDIDIDSRFWLQLLLLLFDEKNGFFNEASNENKSLQMGIQDLQVSALSVLQSDFEQGCFSLALVCVLPHKLYIIFFLLPCNPFPFLLSPVSFYHFLLLSLTLSLLPLFAQIRPVELQAARMVNWNRRVFGPGQ